MLIHYTAVGTELTVFITYYLLTLFSVLKKMWQEGSPVCIRRLLHSGQWLSLILFGHWVSASRIYKRSQALSLEGDKQVLFPRPLALLGILRSFSSNRQGGRTWKKLNVKDQPRLIPPKNKAQQLSYLWVVSYAWLKLVKRGMTSFSSPLSVNRIYLALCGLP